MEIEMNTVYNGIKNQKIEIIKQRLEIQLKINQRGL